MTEPLVLKHCGTCIESDDPCPTCPVCGVDIIPPNFSD